MKLNKYLVKPGEKVKMNDFDPNDSSEFDGNKKDGKEALLKLNKEIEALQELMYAEGQKRLLVILQAMDTAGKDGVISPPPHWPRPPSRRCPQTRSLSE